MPCSLGKGQDAPGLPWGVSRFPEPNDPLGKPGGIQEGSRKRPNLETSLTIPRTSLGDSEKCLLSTCGQRRVGKADIERPMSNDAQACFPSMLDVRRSFVRCSRR